MQPMKNKTVLITGASSGIGAACAELFASVGAKLLLCARRLEQLDKHASELRKKYHSDIHTFRLDVTQRSAVSQQLASLSAEWSKIDILINNAGLAAGLDFIQDGDIDDWEAMIETNVKGLLYVTKAILPGMIERNAGHIINIGSIAGHQVYPKGAVYCGTKFAVNAITQGLRMDLLGKNIRVTTVDPGAVETNFSLVRFKGDTERATKVYERMHPLTASDVADAVLYCATRPPHVNISEMLLMPTDQASATLITRRERP